MDKLNKKLNDKFGANVVKSHEWKEVVDELYGKKDDRTRLAVEVLAILNAHKNYWKWAKRYILLNLPDRRKIDVTETGIALYFNVIMPDGSVTTSSILTWAS